MIPVLNRPFMEYTLAHLRHHGITDVVLAAHYLPDKIRDHFGDGSAFGVRLSYSVEPSSLGTAGAVKHAQGLLHGPCFVFNGDVYMDLDLTKMAADHGRNGALVTIALTEVKDTSRYGVVETDGAGRVQRFLEKPAPGVTRARTINAGCYIMEPAALDQVPPGQRQMFEQDVFPALLRQGLPVYGHACEGYWIDIGTPQDYLELHRALLERPGLDPPPAGEPRGRGIWIGREANIHGTARLRGPLVVGAGCSIGADAVLEGPTVLGDHCGVGPKAVVRRSVVWDHVEVGDGARLDGCLVSDHSSVAAGVRLRAGQVVSGDRVLDVGPAKAGTGRPVPRP
jgi:mannose-1-phosphate guanylyltransferase